LKAVSLKQCDFGRLDPDPEAEFLDVIGTKVWPKRWIGIRTDSTQCFKGFNFIHSSSYSGKLALKMYGTVLVPLFFSFQSVIALRIAIFRGASGPLGVSLVNK
jgi:hypothetical protein